MKKYANKSLCVLLSVLVLLGACGFCASAEERNEYSVVRQNCTFYGDPATQRGFTWYTEANCDTSIRVVAEADFDEDFTEAELFTGTSYYFQDNYCHKVVVDGLEPGTVYYYQVGSLDENEWGNIGKFVTDDCDDSFSFLAIADVQASSLANFKKASLVMGKGVETDPDAAFIVNLGDFVNDCTNDEWTWYGDTFADYNSNYTLVPVAGNHEGNPTVKLNPGWFANQFNLLPAEDSLTVNGVYYSYDYGNAHFCVLNSNDMYPMTEQQRNWIINDLTNSDAQWKIVLLHRSPYSAGKNINKPDTIIMRTDIINLMDETDVDLVLSGHDHMYMRTYQCYGDAVCGDTEYITEVYEGEEVTFASDPQGTVYALPGTAGTKRYAVNEDAIDPIMECAEVAETVRDKGGCFADIKIDGDKLIYKAYLVEDDTLEVTQIDEYAIKKTVAGEAGESEKPTDIIGTIDGSVMNFVAEFMGMLYTYLFKLLPQVIMDLF